MLNKSKKTLAERWRLVQDYLVSFMAKNELGPDLFYCISLTLDFLLPLKRIHLFCLISILSNRQSQMIFTSLFCFPMLARIVISDNTAAFPTLTKYNCPMLTREANDWAVVVKWGWKEYWKTVRGYDIDNLEKLGKSIVYELIKILH